MTENTDVARTWLEALAARGVTAGVRKNRLWLSPASAYAQLSDAERLVLRDHRQAIKQLIADGISLDVVHTDSADTTSASTTAAPPLLERCRWCGREPCIGEQHDLYLLLHPLEAQKRADEYAQKVMMRMIGIRDGG